MQQVSTRDQQWHVAVEWSPFDHRFDIRVLRWERDRPTAQWALESTVVIPIVHPHDLERQLRKALDQVVGDVQLVTGSEVGGPFD